MDRTSSSQAPLTVQFDASASTDTEPGALTYEWDFDGDGTFDAEGVRAAHTYDELGQYIARLRVTDSGGRTGLTSTEITVGNTAPKVTIETPPNGAFFDWGNAVPFKIAVSDAEDGDDPVCSRVQWTFGLGHDAHAHPETTGTGCSGAWATPANAPEHGETENIYGVVVVSYRDNGAGDIPGALGEATLILNPKQMQAEHADATSGVTTTADDGASGKFKVTSFDAGDWIAYDPVDFTGIGAVQTRASGEGTLSLRWGSPTAEPFAAVAVPPGSGWQTVTTALGNAPKGTGRLYVTSSGGVEVDGFTFQGGGVADTTPPAVRATLNPAEPNGANGWYTGNVTLTVTATDNGAVSSRQYSLDGGATWANANNAVTLAFEGSRDVRYRAIDSAGNVSQVGTVTVKIDKTAPALSLSGVEASPYGDSASITPVFSATDAASGVAGVTAKIGGTEVASGEPVELWRLGPGEHELVVTATDRAGRTTTRAVKFTVATSYADVRTLVGRFKEAGSVTAEGADALTAQLNLAEKHEEKSKEQDAIDALERFVKLAGKDGHVIDATVRAALVRDAQVLIALLREG
ncbi:OmpL47-type beta-barrel domain-containing protein [Thermomonospora amylolytica]|uniref:OmpL47-type beta-barrel domain-containing protein n=1 Tax=Thermomonospora amylolytica TaxID=1411117 RepID=UPI0018E4EE9B|nr:carbohydrate-binding protein [Thermomonospora amylolytica]